jgi:hypothetical protein
MNHKEKKFPNFIPRRGAVLLLLCGYAAAVSGQNDVLFQDRFEREFQAGDTFVVEVQVNGLERSGLALKLDAMGSAQLLSIAQDGRFSFTNPVEFGAAYQVSIQSQPISQVCDLRFSSGLVSGPVPLVLVDCVADSGQSGSTLIWDQGLWDNNAWK